VIKSRAKAIALEAMAHQKVSLVHDQFHPEVFDMSDPGTGKTAVRVWAFAGRRRKRGGCALVLAPRSLLRLAWGNDFAKFAPDMVVSIATNANRAEALALTADVYVTNHDAVKELVKMPKAWFAKFDELIIDESTAYKNHTSQRSRATAKIRKFFKRVSCLSATPSSNGICDVWHQAYLLDHGKRLGPNFFGFRSNVCTGKQVGASQHAMQWTDKPGAEEAVFGLLSEIVVRHRFEDCVDIPATHTYSVDYYLEAKQRKIYEDMERDQLFQLHGGVAGQVAAKLQNITAINAAAVATKLLQIASGAVYDNAGKYHVIDRGRYETLLEMASARKHPLMLFFWSHQKELLVEEAKKRGMTYCVFDGAANDLQRSVMVTEYQAGRYDVMFGHPQTVAHGLTLTRGTSVIWPGPTYNLEWLKQANKRQARIGQKEKTEVVTLIAPGTIEQKVYDMVMGKDGRMSNLLDLFASMSPSPIATKVARKMVAA
jgi:SNF2 family DNA or RNA helicase